MCRLRINRIIMKRTLNLLLLSSVGVIIFAALKVLSDSSISSWGIAVCASIFLFTAIYWVILIPRNNEATRSKNLDKL